MPRATVRGVVRSQHLTSRNDPGLAHATLPRELLPKMMKGMDCVDKKMMMRHKKGATDNCPRTTPSPTKRPARLRAKSLRASHLSSSNLTFAWTQQSSTALRATGIATLRLSLR